MVGLGGPLESGYHPLQPHSNAYSLDTLFPLGALFPLATFSNV